MKHNLRLAQVSDSDGISNLIKLSARELGGKFYTSQTIESALKGAFGLDSQLIEDQSYYVIESNTQIIACGGWSFRKTLFGSNSNKLRNSNKLNPKTDSAKIRAFFIHPDFSRLGLGKVILSTCETQAKTHGFAKCQLMATLSGIDFYHKNAYRGKDYVYHHMDDKNKIEFLPMSKTI